MRLGKVFINQIEFTNHSTQISATVSQNILVPEDALSLILGERWKIQSKKVDAYCLEEWSTKRGDVLILLCYIFGSEVYFGQEAVSRRCAWMHLLLQFFHTIGKGSKIVWALRTAPINCYEMDMRWFLNWPL